MFKKIMIIAAFCLLLAGISTCKPPSETDLTEWLSGNWRVTEIISKTTDTARKDTSRLDLNVFKIRPRMLKFVYCGRIQSKPAYLSDTVIFTINDDNETLENTDTLIRGRIVSPREINIKYLKNYQSQTYSVTHLIRR